MTTFSREQYSKRASLFSSLRARGNATRAQFAKIDNWKEWSVADSTAVVGQKKTGWTHTFGEAFSYVDRCSLGGVNALSRALLRASYSVFGDLRRSVALGEPTQGLEYTFKWTRADISAELHTGDVCVTTPSEGLMTVVSANGRDRSSISRATGWDRNSCSNMTSSDVTTFINLARASCAGGNRFTRLVKGCLIYMDLMYGGDARVSTELKNLIEYEPEPVLMSYRVSGRSYAYSSQNTSVEHILLLSLMGNRYPNKEVPTTCRATIPEDGDHYVVVRGAIRHLSGSRTVTLTYRGVYSALVKYAAEVGSPNDLEPAMVVASSMYHNRYLQKVSLPSVSSVNELIMPAMVENDVAVVSRPHVNKETLATIGKLHQMSLLLMIKDVIIAAKVSTRSELDYRRVAMQWLNNYDMLMSRYNVNATALKLVEATPQMKWSYLINRDDLIDLDGISMFECLWLCEDGTLCMKNGGIIMMKNAKKDGHAQNPYLEVLKDEIKKGRIIYDTKRIPDGDFTIAGRYIVSDEDAMPKAIQYNEVRIKRKKGDYAVVKPKARYDEDGCIEELYDGSMEKPMSGFTETERSEMSEEYMTEKEEYLTAPSNVTPYDEFKLDKPLPVMLSRPSIKPRFDARKTPFKPLRSSWGKKSDDEPRYEGPLKSTDSSPSPKNKARGLIVVSDTEGSGKESAVEKVSPVRPANRRSIVSIAKMIEDKMAEVRARERARTLSPPRQNEAVEAEKPQQGEADVSETAEVPKTKEADKPELPVSAAKQVSVTMPEKTEKWRRLKEPTNTQIPDEFLVDNKNDLKWREINIDKANEEMATMESRVQQVEEADKRAKEERAERVPADAKSDAYRILVEKKVDPTKKLFGMSAAKWLEYMMTNKPKGYYEVMRSDINEFISKYTATTIAPKHILDWVPFADSVQINGALRSARRAQTSGTNYLFSESDSTIMNVALNIIRKSNGEVWPVSMKYMGRMQREFYVNKVDRTAYNLAAQKHM
ncbi:putative coat protein [Alphachrysovirus cerasi]|uniref:Putative coat protein n=1 Tax=Alphachrysovirus cerasi TaxID=284687 RepID=Q65A73_9VIRU|nr:putative coat protein [Alphachrysovirus cerasi]